MRNKKPFLILTTLLLSAFVIIALLAFLSKKASKRNGFNRKMFNARLIAQQQVSFPVPINKIIGSHEGKLYFQGNSPYEVFTTDLDLSSLANTKLFITPAKKLQSGFRMFLYERHVYVSFRKMPGIIDYNLDSGRYDSHALNQFYSKEAMLSKDQFLFRTINPHSNDPVFIKLHLNNQQSRQEDHFSERNGKGNFPTDGILYFDSTTRQACYTYFYQNGFICMDTNLNLTLKARTIDTITKREIQVAHEGSSYTMKQPPPFVNSTGAVSGGSLFLQSTLKADNEYSLDFKENTVIDVYSLKNGAYKGSFYVPDYKGRKSDQFHVINKKLYAIYDKTVVLYDLHAIAGL